MDIQHYKKYEPIDGKWYITKELGRGAFGSVFEIERHDFTNTKSALKIISIPASASEVSSYREENYTLDEKSISAFFYGFVEEFVKEFELMSKLKGNSNIVSIEDYDVKEHTDEIGWDILIRMELLTPMNKHFAKSAPTTGDVIKLGIDICKALEVCQKFDIVHRDIKPSNIFVSATGEYKLGDFGVARNLEKTSSGLSKKGTYTYMAPEVYRGEAYGPGVDLYSLGIVMYRLLNNNMEPFKEGLSFVDAENALARRMKGEPLPKPANADGELAEIILKACAFDPKSRFESPTQMREALESVLSGESATILPVEAMVDDDKTCGIFDAHASIATTEVTADDKTVGIFDSIVTESVVSTAEPIGEDDKTASIFSNVVPESSSAAEEVEMVKCPNCGREFEAKKGQKFCSKCGADLNSAPNVKEEAEVAVNTVASAEMKEEKKKSHKGLWITLGVISVVIMLAVILIITITNSSSSNNDYEDDTYLSDSFAESNTDIDNDFPETEEVSEDEATPIEQSKCLTCGSVDHTEHPTCPTCGSTAHTTHPKCPTCGSTAHTTHPKCPTCGSTAHTTHPTCPTCGSTAHTTHPECLVCGSTEHEIHPISDYTRIQYMGEGRSWAEKWDIYILDENNKPIKNLGRVSALANTYSCGRARLYTDVKRGYIDKNGNWVIVIPYSNYSADGVYCYGCNDFSNNVAYIKLDMNGHYTEGGIHNVGINTSGVVFGCSTCTEQGLNWRTVHPTSFAAK